MLYRDGNGNVPVQFYPRTVHVIVFGIIYIYIYICIYIDVCVCVCARCVCVCVCVEQVMSDRFISLYVRVQPQNLSL